jgi:hypothetical protein
MMNWRGFERKRLWPNFQGTDLEFTGGTVENHKTLSQASRYPGRDLSPGPPAYESGVLTTRPGCSVQLLLFEDLLPLLYWRKQDNGRMGLIKIDF